jgi:hypothetical protein
VSEPLISISPRKHTGSQFQLANCTVKVKGDDGLYRDVPIKAILVIDHPGLWRLVQKAFDNKSKKSSDGPLTVHVSFH